jgi:uncharacterized delta-60 repeat protein
MIRTFLAVFTLIYSFIGSAFPQVVEGWVSRYNASGNNEDIATSLALDNYGNVYVTGYSFISGPWHDYATIKYDSNGDTVWVRRYNGTGNNTDLALAIAVDAAGNVYVTGESIGAGPGEDYATVKYNSVGDQQWVARYNGPGNYWDRARAIKVDDSGYVYVTGDSYGNGYDFATIKYDSNGDTVWLRRYDGGNGQDFSRDLVLDDSGNVYVTGYIDGLGTFTDYATIKYSSSGNLLWESTYDGLGSGPDFAVALALDTSRNVYVTGTSRDSSNIEDLTTIKYNSDGEEIWVARYDAPESLWDVGYDIAVDDVGNVYVTGQSYSIGTDRDCITIKYNSDGDTVWVRKYNGPDNDEDCGRAIAIDNSGNVYVTGESYSYDSDNDYATIKYNVNGVQEWVMRYNGPANDEDNSVSVAVDATGNVFVTGVSLGIGTDNDYATIKYSQTTGIEPVSNHIPEDFSLSQNYPNPFNPTTKIRYSVPKSSAVVIKVFDILGNEIETLVNEEKPTGTYEVEFNGHPGLSPWGEVRNLPSGRQGLTSGVYFYQLRAGSFVETKKMLLLK